jgi:hypothetical protein
VAARTVLNIRTDLCCFCHQQIQLTLRKFIELLEFNLPPKQVASKPFPHLFLQWDLFGHATGAATTSLAGQQTSLTQHAQLNPCMPSQESFYCLRCERWMTRVLKANWISLAIAAFSLSGLIWLELIVG